MLVELKKIEFDTFASTHIHNSFQQNSYWAKFMEGDGWHSYFVGYKDNNQIIAATLLLSKNTPLLKKRYFYAPRGFLIDYNNTELVQSFTKDVVQFVKQKKGIYLKIDPYIPWVERNKDGELIEGGKDNSRIVNMLEKIGFVHVGNDFKRNMVQPRWLYAIDTRGKTIEDLESEMHDKTRQIIHRNEREGIAFRFLEEEEIPQFVDIMKETSDKYHTLEYTKQYYEDFMHCFPKENIKMAVVELHPKEAIQNIENQLKELKQSYYDRAFKKEEVLHMNESTFEKKEREQEEMIARLEEKQKNYEDILQEKGEKILLGGYFIILYGNEVIALHGGIYEEWKKLDAAVTLHYEMLKYTKEHHYELYNLYEISGDFRENSPMYGSFLFKRNFGGEVVELIGEFDYIIDLTAYSFLKYFFPSYYGIKVIRKEKV